MKRFYLFFASVILIMASAIFVGCKMNGGGNGNNQSGSEAQNTPDATYGFVPATEYTVVIPNVGTQTMTGANLIKAASDTGMVNGVSYTIDGTTVTLTADGVEKY